ncbi:MAG: DNA/RNA nuclease SfsA [Alphaproteobacteria bacterium]
MIFAPPLVRATLLRRYKRFLADVRLADGSEAVAHCPNPGSMMGLAVAGADIWLAPAAAPGRKLAWTWVLEAAPEGLVGIDANRPNALVAEALAAGALPAFAGYASIRREVRYGTNSRVDFLLEGPGRPPCYLEVKNVHLRRDSGADAGAEFPDCRTARGAKHMEELGRIAAAGARAATLWIVQRDDCQHFRLARDIDPRYAGACAAARAAGMEAHAWACRLSPERIDIHRPLPIYE